MCDERRGDDPEDPLLLSGSNQVQKEGGQFATTRTQKRPSANWYFCEGRDL